MATQKDVTDALKEWEEATTMKRSAAAAARGAQAFAELQGDSGPNLLKRTPRLLDMLGAVQAGRLMARAEYQALEAQRRAAAQGQQGALI